MLLFAVTCQFGMKLSLCSFLRSGENIHTYTYIHIYINNGVFDVQGCWPAEYHGCNQSTHKREYPLDSKHTHFILVDDGTKHQYSKAEANFRAALEDGIANSNLSYGDSMYLLLYSINNNRMSCIWGSNIK